MGEYARRGAHFRLALLETQRNGQYIHWCNLSNERLYTGTGTLNRRAFTRYG